MFGPKPKPVKRTAAQIKAINKRTSARNFGISTKGKQAAKKAYKGHR